MVHGVALGCGVQVGCGVGVTQFGQGVGGGSPAIVIAVSDNEKRRVKTIFIQVVCVMLDFMVMSVVNGSDEVSRTQWRMAESGLRRPLIEFETPFDSLCHQSLYDVRRDSAVLDFNGLESRRIIDQPN